MLASKASVLTMRKLCKSQISYEELLKSIVFPDLDNPCFIEGVLLIGKVGCGKRTISRAFAENVGLEFNEVRVDIGSETEIIGILFGNEAEAINNVDQQIGEAATNKPSILYLSGMEGLSPRLHQSIHKLIIRRKYTDALGREWNLANSTLIIAALSLKEGDYIVGNEHWLCTSFHRRIYISPPNNVEELLFISKNIVDEANRGIDIAKDVNTILLSTYQAPGNLHALRRWLESASSDIRENKAIFTTNILEKIHSDIHVILAHIPYRGRCISIENFNLWINQFPKELHATVMRLVICIKEDYYVSVQKYHDAIEYIIRQSDIPRYGKVVFCKWQNTGNSAPRVASEIKAQANWNVSGEIDLSRPVSDWPNFPKQEKLWLVIVDDFVGTGDTLEKLVDTYKGKLKSFLELYPESKIRVLILIGYERSIQNANMKMRFKGKSKIVTYRLLSDMDRCFHDSSRIIHNIDKQKELKEFCYLAKSEYMRTLSRDLAEGYKGTGALIVFHHSIPNNTLPIIWYDCSDDWKPLFARSGLS